MGIFDDAIRQHLDLKRRQGADESELKQLEDEAFGLPARPGDPDFPETGEEAAQDAAEGLPASDAGGDARAAQASAAEAPPAELPTVQEAEPEPGLESDPEEEPEAEPAPEPDELPPHGDALLADPEAPPPPPPPDEAPVEDEGAPGFTTAEREAIADEPTEFFDQAPAELELGELDLDLEEEIDEVGSLEEQPLTEEQLVEEPEPAEELPIPEEPEPEAPEPEALDVAEEAAGAPVEAEPPAEPSGEEAPAEDQPAEAEDVLEETPEFLRDNPDDDELWFEQGKPKDFDF